MTQHNNTQTLRVLLNSIEHRIIRVRITQLLLRIIVVMLSLYIIFLAGWFLVYGQIPDRLHISYPVSVFVLCGVVCVIKLIFHNCPVDKTIQLIDRTYQFNDSLNASYEILRKNRNWNDWNNSILQYAVKHLSKCTIRLSENIPYKIHSLLIVLLILTCTTAGLFLFEKSDHGSAWRISRLKSMLDRQITMLTDTSDKLINHENPVSKDNSLQTQRITHELRMIAKTDNPSTRLQMENSIIDSISDMQNDLKTQDLIPTELIKHLSETTKTVQSLKSMDAGIAGEPSSTAQSAKPGKGVGNQKADIAVKKESSKFSQKNGSEKLVFQKNGGFSTDSAAIDEKDSTETAPTTVTEERTSNGLKSSITTQQKSERLKPMEIGNTFVQSPVWFETFSPTRREYIKRYFSMNSNIKEQK